MNKFPSYSYWRSFRRGNVLRHSTCNLSFDCFVADDSGCAVSDVNCLRSLELWDRGFESHAMHGCPCDFILCVGSALVMGWSPVKGVLPTDTYIHKSLSCFVTFQLKLVGFFFSVFLYNLFVNWCLLNNDRDILWLTTLLVIMDFEMCCIGYLICICTYMHTNYNSSEA
jgi:hypothetical protein